LTGLFGCDKKTGRCGAPFSFDGGNGFAWRRLPESADQKKARFPGLLISASLLT